MSRLSLSWSVLTVAVAVALVVGTSCLVGVAHADGGGNKSEDRVPGIPAVGWSRK
jgi:hypothetical protein